MAFRMVRIGLHRVQEKTFAYWVSVLIGAQPGFDATCLQEAGGAMALQLVQDLKAAHAQNMIGAEAGEELLAHFPGTITEFKAVRPLTFVHAYSEELPVSSPIDAMTLAKLKSMVPCRSSKSTVSSTPKPDSTEALLQKVIAAVQQSRQEERPPRGVFANMLCADSHVEAFLRPALPPSEGR